MNTFKSLIYDLPERIAAPLTWLPPLLARVAVGWVFLQTGFGKLQNIEPVIDFFTQLGIPFPQYQAPFVATVELVCGSLVLVGLLTRFASVMLIGTMVVAIATAQWPQLDSLAGFLGLVETLYIVLFAWLAIAGPGPVSVDRAVEAALGDGAPSSMPGTAHLARSTR